MPNLILSLAFVKKENAFVHFVVAGVGGGGGEGTHCSRGYVPP